MPTDGELELSFYEKFLWSKGLEPYPVQEQAISKIFARQSVLVTVPTGTGKTLMAKAALHAAIGRGERAIYTTPLRALTEEKYRELCADFGEGYVGFATGDYKVNREAPIQVEVAEILWNRIVADKHVSPADIVVMDEGHYFNDPERGYVWEQSIIGLDPRTQLVILSATVGRPEQFCHWVELTRRVPMELVESRERKVPLVHEYREDMMIETVRELAHTGDVPAIIFVFGREQCFEVARLLKSCRRFTTDEEKAKVEAMCDAALLPSGVRPRAPAAAHARHRHPPRRHPPALQAAGRAARARAADQVRGVDRDDRGGHQPAGAHGRVPGAAQVHQEGGAAGHRGRVPPDGRARRAAAVRRPRARDHAGARGDRQRSQEASSRTPPSARRTTPRRSSAAVYARARRARPSASGDIVWTPEIHAELVKGEPAELRSKTKITAEQVLAIGLPDLAAEALPAEEEAGGPAPPAGADEAAVRRPPPRPRCRRRCGSTSSR